MKLLLDTHALFWWLSDDDNIGGQARASIADPGHNVLISVVPLWEIAVKLRLGKLEAEFNAISDAVGRPEFSLLDISVEHLLMLGRLPVHPDHPDSFDHLIIAQAIAEGATFVLEDRHIVRYPVQFVTCSDPTAQPLPR